MESHRQAGAGMVSGLYPGEAALCGRKLQGPWTT